MSDENTTDNRPATPISEEALLARGYKKYPDAFEKAVRCFQRAVDDAHGRRYFVNFREWAMPEHGLTFDAEICGETDTDGYVWATIKETSIEATESRAEALWIAMGRRYYDA